MCVKVKDVGCFLSWLASPMDVSYTMHSKGLKKKMAIWKGNETTVTKAWASLISYTKINLNWIKRPKYNTEYYKTYRGKHGQGTV